MGAPSSMQEAKDRAAEIASRPNLQAVVDRIFVVLEACPPGKRRDSLECLTWSLELDLGPGQDITDDERDGWMRELAS